MYLYRELLQELTVRHIPFWQRAIRSIHLRKDDPAGRLRG